MPGVGHRYACDNRPPKHESPTDEVLNNLQFLTGMKMKELAGIFDVDEETMVGWHLYFKQMPREQEAHLRRVFDILQEVKEKLGMLHRDVILATYDEGISAFSLLREKKYERVLPLVTSGPGTAPEPLPPLPYYARPRFLAVIGIISCGDALPLPQGPTRLRTTVRQHRSSPLVFD